MAGRSDMTVVIRTRGLLLRADVVGRETPRVTRWNKDWPEVAEAVAYALEEGDKPGKRVWVLDSEVWLGVVDLPAGAVAGQSDKDLAGPAAFEAEAVSDLSPAAAVTSVQRRRMVDRGDQFLVTQARRTDVTAVAKVVRGAGAKLAGLGHPSGLPAALQVTETEGVATGGSSESGWRRVEFWAESVVVAESVGGRAGLIPLGVGPHGDWRRTLAPVLRAAEPVAEDQTLVGPSVRVRGGTQWRESTAGEGTARWLAAGEDPADEDDGVPTWDLAEQASAEAFARGWAEHLAAVEPGAATMSPTLRPPKAQASRVPAVLVGVLAFALAVFAVYYVRDEAAHRLADVEAQLEIVQEERKKISERGDQVEREKASLRAKQRDIAELESRVERLTRDRSVSQVQRVVVDRRESLEAMMASLTRSSSDATMIRSIEHGSPRHEIEGMATSPEAATRLARDLSDQLDGIWRVSPAQIEPESGAGQVAWRFKIILEPARLGGLR
ncbi:MAG: hypothetical protein AAF750_09675 [Planctomycetota bacterium]